MENEDFIKLNERLNNIDTRILLIFDELQRRNTNETCSFAMYASTLLSAQEINEIQALFSKASCEHFKGIFEVDKFRLQFETFRQRHLPQSSVYSLRAIAEGFIVEGRMVDLCQQILDDIKKHPEKHFQVTDEGG